MAFTVRDYHDLLSLLNAHLEWREELRRVLLSDDFLALPQIVRELAAAQKRTEERLDGVETRLDSLEVELGKTRSELGRLSAVIGASLEDEAGSVLATVMRQKGYRVLQDASALRFNGDVDVVLPVEDEQGRRLWVLMESKMRLIRADVLKWAQRIRSAEWRDALKNAGCQPPYLAYIYAIRSDLSARGGTRTRNWAGAGRWGGHCSGG